MKWTTKVHILWFVIGSTVWWFAAAAMNAGKVPPIIEIPAQALIQIFCYAVGFRFLLSKEAECGLEERR